MHLKILELRNDIPTLEGLEITARRGEWKNAGGGEIVGEIITLRIYGTNGMDDLHG